MEKHMSKIKLFLKFVFYFFGTCLHELAHYIAAVILGKAEGFSVIPKIEGDRFIFGSVKSRARYKVLTSFIAAAPLVWWVVLFLVMRHFHIISISNGMPEINTDMIIKRIETFSLSDLFYLWLFMQMLWAGKLSMQDIKNFFGNLFSISGIILILTVAILFYLSRKLL
ncbi:MAG: hypothetical protein A2X59_00185 [Nitrospirae bacterium GWC2_42_7]|nr:MAG: hypothetical protein A2X59_00185 [Nitrospirae bacterium GWC2_42_7]